MYLICKLLNENERSDKEVGCCHVCLEALIVLVVSQLFQQIADNFNADLHSPLIASATHLER